jgi:hypothetical protein
MPIDNLPSRYRELGKLKLGEDRGDRPAQLKTWRITSDQARLIEAAAEVWGGSPVFRAEGGGEVVTETDELEVLIPAQDLAGGQWWEHWTAGGLQRRCSGSALVDYDPDEPTGWRKVAPCLCDEENGPRVCKPTTVLRVLLPQLPDLGVWKLTSRSIYAAAELPAAVDFLLSRAVPAPAVLGVDSRSSKSAGGPRHDFVVPVLRTRSTLLELASPTPAGEGLQPLPFEGQASAAPDAHEGVPSLPAPGPGPDIPPRAPQNGPQDAQNADPGPPAPRNPELEALAAFLEAHTPDSIGRDAPELIEVLDELERLAIAAGVWEPGALDAAAERWVDSPTGDWRRAHGYQLHTFAQRAVLALGKETP